MSNLASLKPKSGLLCAVLAVAGTWVVGCGDEDGDNGGSGATAGTGGKGGSTSGGAAGKGGSGGSGGTAKGGSGGKGGSAGSGEAGSPPGAGGSGDAGSSGDAGAGGAVSSCDVVLPQGYDGANFYTSTGKGSGIDSLVLGMASLISGSATPPGLMTLSEQILTTDPAPVPATAAAMSTAFNTGTPSPFSVAPVAFQQLAAAMFAEHEAASLATWDGTPAEWVHTAAPAGEGGVLLNSAGTSARMYNERGLEPRQVMDKGGYSAVFYSHARAVAEAGPITAATVDVIARALGVENPAMPIAPMTLPTGAYARTANYAHQVGLMAPLKNALIRAQAYAGNADCAAELQTAITDIFTGWERAAMARAAHYAYQARTKVQSGSADIFVTNDALHQLGEGMGLAIGWRGVSGKIITESQLDTLADGLLIPGLPDMNNVVTHWLLNNDAQELEDALERLDAAVLQVQTVYGFTTEQMNNFKLATPVPG